MTQDQKGIDNMVKVMRYECVPKGQTVFTYGAVGDTFYMLIHGKVSCRIPAAKQVIRLTEEERYLF